MAIIDNIYKSAKWSRRFVYGAAGRTNGYVAPRAIVLLTDEDEQVLAYAEIYKERVYLAALLISSCQPEHATMGSSADRYVRIFREEHNARSG